MLRKLAYFLRALTNKTQAERREKCMDGKISNKNIFVMLSAIFMSEKLKSHVIRKSEKLQCFKNVNTASLPVHYKSILKTCMTFTIFSQWLICINNMIKRKVKKKKKSLCE